MLYREVQNTNPCIFGSMHRRTAADTASVKEWCCWVSLSPECCSQVEEGGEHCRPPAPTASRAWHSLPERFALSLGWWIKAVLQATFNPGLGVYLGQRELLLLESRSHLFTGTAVPGRFVSVCYKPTLLFLKLLAAPKAASHVPYNYWCW